MVQRETYGRFAAALRHLAHTVPPGTRFVAVDTGSPAPVRRELERVAADVDALLLRVDDVLTPNEARTLAMPWVSTRYVAFIDNDAFGDEGWLDHLVDCAEETGAWAVGPLYGIGDPSGDRVHMAGGVNRITEADGRRQLVEEHLHSEARLADARAAVQRSPTELIEFHCVLLRRSALETVPLDLGYLSMFEHNALCLDIAAAGGSIWLEPAARVTYWPWTDATSDDSEFFRQRWSRRWNRLSARHFASSFDLNERDVVGLDQFRFASNHRTHLTSTGGVARRLPSPIRRAGGACLARIDAALPVRPRPAWGGDRPTPHVAHRPAWADPSDVP